MSSSSSVHTRLKNCAWAMGIFVIQLGCLVLIGWALNNRALTSTFTYLVPMNPMTAVCFVLLGAALLLLSHGETAGSGARRVARGVALTVVILGSLRLLDALLGWEIRVDWLLFPEKMAVATAYGIVRMAPTTAFCLVLTGLSLTSLDLSAGGRKISWPSQALGSLVALVSLVTVASFVSGLRELPGALAGFVPMALNTACAFLALVLGIVCARSDRGLVSLLQSTQPGGAVVRRLFPTVVLIPSVWFIWSLLRRLVFHSTQAEDGTSLVIASLTVGLAALICWTAVSLNRADSRRRQAEEKMRASRDLAREVIEGTTDAVFVKDLQGRYLMINAAGARSLGRSPEEIIGHDDTANFDQESAQKIIERDREIMASGQTCTYEDIDAWSNGQTRTWQSTKGPLRNQQGEVVGLIGISRDITLNKRAERALQEEVTERRRIEQALQAAYDDLEARVQARTAELASAGQTVRESEQRLRFALNAGRMTTWTIHLGTGEVDWSTVRHSKGWVPGTFPETFETFLRNVHPGDLDEAFAVFARCKADGTPFIFQYRYIRPGDGVVRWLESRGQPLHDSTGRVDIITGVSLDITGRKAQEERLQAHARQQAAIASLGHRALELGDSGLEAFLTEAADLVAEVLGADFTTVFEHLPASNLLIRRAGHGWPEEAINCPDAGAPASMNTVAGYALLTGQPAVCRDMRREPRFRFSPYAQRHGAVAIADVIIARAASGSGLAPAPFGVLNAIFREPHDFSDQDIAFLQAVANTLASTITGHRAERQLAERARQQAAVARLGQRALELGENSLDELLTEAVQRVAQTLGADFSTVLEHQIEQGLLIRRAGYGWPPESIGKVQGSAVDGLNSVAGYTLMTGQAVVREDMRQESDFRLPNHSIQAGVIAIASVIIAREAGGSTPAPSPFGVLNVLFRQPHVFSQEDVAFLQAVANTLATAIARQSAEAAIQQARLEADRANLAKSEFLSRMSHELRTPLNAILGFGQLLEMDDLSEQQQQGVAQILKGGRHLLSLIDEVLDLARVESGRVELSVEPVSVAELLQESLSFVRPLASERQIELLALDSAAHQGHGVHVLADRQRLKQVLLNLLSNAVKYNEEAGRITIGCLSTPGCGDQVRIRIGDTGPGISDEQRRRLFTPFDRLGAENSAVQGTGLGLALSKRLVEAMGGTLGLEEQAADGAGQGAVFYIDLPSCPSLLSVQETRPEFGCRGVLPTLPQAKTLLYIEDNLSNRELVQALLRNQPGVQLLTAMQGTQGLELARQHRPNLILLDLHLPGLAGWEVLAQLQTDESTKTIPVIVVSADATEIQIQRLLQAGARAYLTKPLDVQRFLAVLREFLDPRRLEENLASCQH